MNAVKNLVMFIWGFSLLVFFAVLLSAYYYMPAQVIVSFSGKSGAARFIPKEHLYYYTNACVFIFNVFGAVLAVMVEKFPFKAVSVPNKDWWFDGSYKEEALRLIARNWVYIFVLSGNVVITTAIVVFWKANSSMGADALNYFNTLLPVFGVYFLLLLLYPFIRFRFKTYFSERHIE